MARKQRSRGEAVAGRMVRDVRAMRRAIGSKILVAALTGMVIALVGGASPVRGEDTTGGGGGEPAWDRVIPALERLVDSVSGALREPAANPADIAGRAGALEHDPRRMFEFVRDRVAFEPYRGRLRGEQGALVAGAGNAIDQSLLLHRLLETAGHRARLVRGALSDEAAEALVQGFLERRIGRTALAGFTLEPPERDADWTAFKQQFGSEADDVFDHVQRVHREATQLYADMVRVTEEQVAFLERHVEAAELSLGRPAVEWRERLTARVGEHVWVQYHDPAEDAWIDLDPSFAEVGYGETRARGGEVIEPAALDRHALTLSLQYRYLEQDEAREQTLLEVEVHADEALSTLLSFAIEPTDVEPPLPSRMMAMGAAGFAQWLGSIERYQARLRVDEQEFASQVFDLKGRYYDVGPRGEVEALQDMAGGVGGVFRGLGGGRAEADTPARQFVALAVDLTFTGPGEASERQRRTLLSAEDLDGAGEGAAPTPLLAWEMWLQPQPVSLAWANHQHWRFVEALWRPLLAHLPALGHEPEALDRLMADLPRSYPNRLQDYALWRQQHMADQWRATEGVALLWDQQQLVIAEHRLCTDGESRACATLTIDVVSNAVSFVPREAEAERLAAESTLRQGVFDTVAEALLLERDATARVRSPIRHFQWAAVLDQPVMIVAPDASALEGAALSARDRAWIERYEPVERRIVALEATGGEAMSDTGWWSLDPRTGLVLGRGEGGRGQAATEYQTTSQRVGFWVLRHKDLAKLGWCIAKVSYDMTLSVGRGFAAEDAVRGGVDTVFCAADYGMGLAMGGHAPWGTGVAREATGKLFGWATGQIGNGHSLPGDIGGALIERVLAAERQRFEDLAGE